MKKIYFLMFAVAFLPFVSNAQVSSNVCTGEIRTNLADAQACADKAEAQGRALGYDIDCNVERLGLGGFTDPTSNQDYILNGVCTVNGSRGHGTYLLAGFQASPGSNAVVQSVNPGWQILKTELEFQNASNQCGGNTPYYVNGSYTCTRPPQPEPSPVTGTTRTSVSSSPEVLGAATYQSIIDSVRAATERVLERYQVYARESLNLNLNTTLSGLTGSSPSNTTSSNQCHVFARTIQAGDSGQDVLALTTALRQEGLLPYTTSLFTAEVMTAVKRLQEKHATEILSMLGLTQGTGLVGDRTRAYLNTQCIKPDTTGSTTTSTTPSTPAAPACTVTGATNSGIRNGVYRYTFSRNANGSWTITLNNPAYSIASDPYYVKAGYSITATSAADLNTQNQGRFNYLSTLPGTVAGNTEYTNLFGSFNNAYYDWDNMTRGLTSACVAPVATPPVTSPTTPTPAPTTPTAQVNTVRYVQVSVSDWDTLPLALREITIFGKNNTIIIPVVVSATDFAGMYQMPGNLFDGNENTTWSATKTSCAGGTCNQGDADLQVITIDLGQQVEVDRVKIVSSGFTDTRVFVIEVSKDGNAYTQIAEVRARTTSPIVDRSSVFGIVSAASLVGPVQY